MTLAQLRTALQARGYGTDTATAQNEVINGRYRELMAMHRWSFNDKQSTALSTTPGSQGVTISSITDLDSIDAVRLNFPVGGTPTEQYDLTWLDPQDFRSRQFGGDFNTAGANGIPMWWTQLNGQQSDIKLLPAPDRIYTVVIDYNANDPDDLVLDGDTPAFPSKFHDILVWGAIVDLAYRERDYAGSQLAQQQYDTRLREFERKYAIRQNQNPTHVRRSAFWDVVGRGSGGWGR